MCPWVHLGGWAVFTKVEFFIGLHFLLPPPSSFHHFFHFCPAVEKPPNITLHCEDSWSSTIPDFLVLYTSFCTQLQAFTGVLTLWHRRTDMHANAEGTSHKKWTNKRVSPPRQAVQEGWEGEENQSYIIDQKLCSSREQKRYQNPNGMSSPVSLQALL